MNNSEIWLSIPITQASHEQVYANLIVENYNGLNIYIDINDAGPRCLLFSSFEAYSVFSVDAKNLYLEKNHGLPTGILFEVENSKYLKWLSTESLSLSCHFNLKHFVLIASNALIEVVTSKNYKIRYQQDE